MVRAATGALVFSKRFEDLAWGMSRCLSFLGALPETLVWDREGAIHDGHGHAGEDFAAFCGRLKLGWRILEARDPGQRVRWSAAIASCARALSRRAASPTPWTSRTSWTAGSLSAPTRAFTAASARSPPSVWLRSRSADARTPRADASHCAAQRAARPCAALFPL